MVEIISNISWNYWVMITNVTESWERREYVLLDKFSESYFVLLYNVFFAIISKWFFVTSK
jgi:hypothetical protein